MPLLPNTQQSTFSGDLYILIMTQALAAVSLLYFVQCFVQLGQRMSYLDALLLYGRLNN